MGMMMRAGSTMMTSKILTKMMSSMNRNRSSKRSLKRRRNGWVYHENRLLV